MVAAGLYDGLLDGLGVGVETGVTLWRESGRVSVVQVLPSRQSHVDEGHSSKLKSFSMNEKVVFEFSMLLEVVELSLPELTGTPPLRAVPLTTLVISGPPTLPLLVLPPPGSVGPIASLSLE